MNFNDYSFEVCVKCWTYNHAPYIKDALDGFTIQRTLFPYVCIIVDDASTDGEPEVLRNYLSEHFDLNNKAVRNEETDDYILSFARHKTNENCFFAVYFLKYNHHGKKSKNGYFEGWVNSIKYHAICEGDDYWTDSHKLARQVSYLEQHDECEMIGCSAYWSIDGELELRNYASKEPRVLSVEEVIRGGGSYIPTCSLLFRQRYLIDIPYWRKIANVGDYPLQIQGALEGNLFYLPEAMCVYRRGHTGGWAFNYYNNPGFRIKHLRAELTWMEELDKKTEHRFQKEIFGRFKSSIHELFLHNKATIKEYFHCIRLVGSSTDYKKMIKNVVKRLVHNKPN